ncbi:hypothetical protein [Pseudorhodobacter sp.]|uniref:hypothetical protein n=1 Tax=Pseudorhodobacter sp. TaxID=1934400 RepID=UPI0026490C19|nr:hypothetical protein [Pseudorhodobacter sp.]MDN5787291.1 hypothetical protein [Pseudorhodobacter sp.]
MDILAAARAEVINRHAFFVGWFTGKLPESAMEDSARAFATDMQMIVPDGQMIGAAEVVTMLRSARSKRGPDFAIRVEMREARLLGDAALIVYDEHQVIEGAKTARRSSALFTADPAAPEGVVWRHLQETWLPNE